MTTHVDPEAVAIRPDRRRAVGTIALVATGALHVAVALDYLGHEVRLFALFVAAGAVQLVLGPRLWRGSRPRRDVAVIAVTAALFLVDVYVRNVGLPIGPTGPRPDPDLLGIGLVLGGIVALAALPAALPPRARFWTTGALAVVAVGVWSLWVAGTLV
jgi:hypothetical protein